MSKGNFLPVSLFYHQDRFKIKWLDFKDRIFSSTFLDYEVNSLYNDLDFNREQIKITDLTDLFLYEANGLQPNGFIFHMSRCGSTLLANFFKEIPDTISFSELQIFEEIQELGDSENFEFITELMTKALLAMGQKRFGNEKYFTLKFNSYNATSLPLINELFPKVPKVFLIRDPLEVIVPNLKEPAQSRFFNADMLNIPHTEIVEKNTLLENCAISLERICSAFLENQNENSLIVDYKDLLTESVLLQIMRLFKIPDNHYAQGIKAFDYYSKQKREGFSDDSKRKRSEASDKVKSVASEVLYPVYEKLYALRTKPS